MKLFLISIAVLTFLTNSVRPQTPGWKEFRSDDLGFRAAFPDKPEESTGQLRLLYAPDQFGNERKAKWQFAGLYFAVSALRDTSLTGADRKTVLRDLQQYAEAEMKCSRVENHEVASGTITGAEFVCYKNNYLYTYRLFVLGQKRYKLTYWVPSSAADDPDVRELVERFTSSFQLYQPIESHRGSPCRSPE